MAEIRTTSSTGGQKGVKPERHDLLPRKGLSAIARVFAFGAEKYADHNWRNRYEWGKSLAALERHIGAFIDGETYDYCDPDCTEKKTSGKRKKGNRTCRNHSGLPHLAHAGFHVLVLLTWLEEDGEGADNPMDDRWPAAMERARRLEFSRVTVGGGLEWIDADDVREWIETFGGAEVGKPGDTVTFKLSPVEGPLTGRDFDFRGRVAVDLNQ